MWDFWQVLNDLGRTPLLGSLSEMQQSQTGRPVLLTVVFGLIPGLSYGPPRTPLPLPDVGGRLHSDGSTWGLLHLPIAEFRGEGSSGGNGSREVRVCLHLATE